MTEGVSQAAYAAARQQAGLIDRSNRGRIVVSGADRASYLQGLFTNDIVALKTGHGCYSAYLTAQGRMITDVWVYELGDVILLLTARDVTATLLAKLDQFIFGEDVQLGDVSDAFEEWALVGPTAASVLSQALGTVAPDALAALPEHGNLRAVYHGAPAIVVRTTDTGEPGFDVLVERGQSGALVAGLEAGGATMVDAGTAETIRVEAGVPLFHRDMDEDTIPLEAGIEHRAISFTKGCYVGQEVIIRVLHRGHGRVARKLVGIVLDDVGVPTEGSVIRSGETEIGRVTSAVRSPRFGAIALGYVQRDYIDPGTAVTVDATAARVVSLPFAR